jgi:hypothetical protein
MAAMIAGSGPATPVLVAARQSRPCSPHDCPRATGDRPANHDTHPHPCSQKDRTRAQRRNSSPLGARPNPHSARRTALPHFTRFRALALFGRRPLQRVDSPRNAGDRKPCMGPIGVKKEVALHLSHFVTSLDCIAARLLSCSAALSGHSPEAACGALKAWGLTASAQTESQYRCRGVQTISIL